jgi:rhodanese-related sulfurtransferase
MINRELRDRLGAPVIMHRASPVPLVDRHVDEGDVLEVGGTTLRVWHTPGHTPDSVCFVGPGFVLTGDTLLVQGTGRTDFPGGDAGAQWDAITQRLFALPGETTVYPGHDYRGQTTSTIERERTTNPRLAGKTREQYVELMGSLGLPFPERIQESLQVNQSGFEADQVAFPSVHAIVDVPEISARELATWLAAPSAPLLLDVREPEEFVGELGHIRGSLLVPMDALKGRLPKLLGYADRPVVLICRAGARSRSAAAILKTAGFTQVVNLAGGMVSWVDAALPTQA